jgi:hypothetical protein
MGMTLEMTISLDSSIDLDRSIPAFLVSPDTLLSLQSLQLRESDWFGVQFWKNPETRQDLLMR